MASSSGSHVLQNTFLVFEIFNPVAAPPRQTTTTLPEIRLPIPVIQDTLVDSFGGGSTTDKKEHEKSGMIPAAISDELGPFSIEEIKSQFVDLDAENVGFRLPFHQLYFSASAQNYWPFYAMVAIVWICHGTNAPVIDVALDATVSDQLQNQHNVHKVWMLLEQHYDFCLLLLETSKTFGWLAPFHFFKSVCVNHIQQGHRDKMRRFYEQLKLSSIEFQLDCIRKALKDFWNFDLHKPVINKNHKN